MNNSREILDLYSPVKEITFNESLGIYMEQNGRRSVPLQINESTFSPEFCLRENTFCPYPIDNSAQLFCIADVMYMSQHVFAKPLETIEIIGKLNSMAEKIMTNDILKEYEKKVSVGGMMNPIILAMNNFIFYHLLNNQLAAPFTGLKMYDFSVADEGKFMKAECKVYELSFNDKDGVCYLLVHFVNPKLAIIYLLSNNPFQGLIPFAVVAHNVVIRLNDAVTNEEQLKESLIENYSISLLEELNGKVYPKFNTDYQSILESLGLLDEAINNPNAFSLGEGAITNASRKAKAKVIKTDRKISGKIDKLASDVKETVKKALLPDAREDIIKDSLPSLSKLIKIALVGGAAFAINPAIAAIGAITTVALRNKARKNERRKILAELREEYELVEEKIKDAESKGDNKNKYQLMRLRNKLKTSIERISYGDNFVDRRSSVGND